MPAYIAMLRGINVSGHKILKMEQLRASFEVMSFRNVKTYVQSGNVIFETGNDSLATLTGRIEKRILSDFGFPVPVLFKTSQDLERIVRDNPFLGETGIDHSN